MQRPEGVRGVHLDPRVFEVALVAVFVAVGQVDVWFGLVDGQGGSIPPSDRPLAAVLSLLAMSMVAVRRRAPLAGLAVMVLAAIAQVRLVTPVAFFFGQFVPIVLMTYAVGAYAGRPWPAAAGLLGAVSGAATVMLSVPSLRTPDTVLFNSLLLVAGWTIGYLVGTRVRRADALTQRAQTLEDERARAITDERARLARELHDIVAHSVSVIAVQAEAGEALLDDEPERAAEAFRSIQGTSRQALVELRRLLGLLRDTDAPAALAPQPGLAEIEELIVQVRAAGLDVDLSVEGAAPTLDPGVNLSAYRVVQESLTNALRHAGSARACVRIRYLPRAIELEVCDDGAGTADGADDVTGGHGLVGMQERVALYGGELLAGHRPEGGFAVRARLPLERP